MTSNISLKEFSEKLKSGEISQERAVELVNQRSGQQFKEPFNIRELERGDLLDVLNCTYISNRFFGKSLSWFSQKLNNNIKNGKPAEFTEEERGILKRALLTISIELEDLADEI